MDGHNDKYSGQALFLAFLGGAVAGVIAGVLLAAKSGQETRWDIQDYARERQQDLIEKAKEVRAALDDVIERGKTFVSGKRVDVEAAVKAKEETMEETTENRSS
jgi:gas vesicle protein